MQEPDAFIPLASIVVSEETFDGILQHVVDMACAGIDSCSMAGITMLDRSGPTTAASTNEVAGRIDATQYEVNSGPCLDAYRRQVVNRIESTDSDERWPEFSRAANAEGVLSTLSLPLIVGGDGLGALNLYSEDESGFDEVDVQMGTIFASHASVTLANARAYWANEELRRNLEIALETRGVIDQAKGILMAREGCSSDEAFDILRRASQRLNRKLHDIAREIVEGARREQ
ncbi:MAG: GAF and ANTAR domain-containing protein [Acidimicrobiales bacterium]|jgi:GAF domain-containing protein